MTNFKKEPFDRFRVPPKQNLIFMPLIWIICFFMTLSAGLKIKKTDKRGIKPPFLVLGTHHSFIDFYVTPLALFPYRANYVSELEGFENYGEWLYRQAGCLGTRKFVEDMALIVNIKKGLDRKGILVFYPEARYANVGTSTEIPISVAKLVKMLKVPVVTLNMKGNYLQSPIWNLKIRKEVRLRTDMNYALTVDDVKRMSVEEIHEKLTELLSYDEYQWQRETKLKSTYGKRAEGLQMPLYQCRRCKAEYHMKTSENRISCASCGAVWSMDEYGTLTDDKTGEAVYIPDWYEWQRREVHKQIENGSYELDMDVRVEALPNAKNFIPCGIGHVTHDEKGFSLTFQDYEDHREKTLTFSPASMFSLHTEYDYRKKGQCFTLSTLDNTYFLFPQTEEYNVTKTQFAVEYLYQKENRNVKRKQTK